MERHLQLQKMFTGCAANSDDNAAVRTAKDTWGKEVTVPEKVESIVCLGSGAPRIAAYLGVMDMLVGAEERCEEVLTFIDDCKQDLHKRTRDVPDSEKKSAYTGAVTFSGRHGFAGTYANFGPFIGANALNVADEVPDAYYFETDLEKVVEWDPDVIFLDPGNMDRVNDEYKTNPGYFDALRAIQEGEHHAVLQ